MTDLDNLKEQKCVSHTKRMDAQEFKWLTLMAASERERARDVFEGLVNQELELEDNQNAILAGQQPLLTDQEVERLEEENGRAHVDFSKLLPSELKRIVRLATTPRFPNGCGKTAFDAVLTNIKELTDGEEEDLVTEFKKIIHIEKSENPRKFAERLEHMAESSEEFHGVHKAETEIVDQVLFAVEDNKILSDTAKCIKRERKKGTGMGSELVKSSPEQDFKAEKRRKRERRKRKKKERKQQQ